MSVVRAANLTAAALLFGGLTVFGVCWFTSTWNGWWILSILMLAGFAWLTAWAEDRETSPEGGWQANPDDLA
jgi:hypothetical protein